MDFIKRNGSLTEPYWVNVRFKCALEQGELVDDYVESYTHMQLTNGPIYGQITYNCCL